MAIDLKRDVLKYKGEYVSVYVRDGWYEFMHDRTGKIVGLLVFTRLPNRDIEKILGRYEYDHVTGTKSVLTSITGGVEEDQTPEECAVVEMHEEAGFDVAAEDLIPLGTFQPSKAEDTIVHLYAYDATDVEYMRRPESISDGTKGEEGARCEWVAFEDCINANSPVFHVAILRLLTDLIRKER